MRRINVSAYERCKVLVEDAKKNLIRVAGPTNAKILMDLFDQVEEKHAQMFKKVCVCVSSVAFMRLCVYERGGGLIFRCFASQS